MSTLTKFKAIKSKELAEAKLAKQQQKWEEKQHQDARASLYREFSAYLHPFDKQTINKHKITLKFHPSKTTIELLIDGKIYRVFVAETRYVSCNCSQCYDGQTGHEGTYSHDINAYFFDKYHDRHDTYFFWYGKNEEEREDHFVRSFKELMDNYGQKLDYE